MNVQTKTDPNIIQGYFDPEQTKIAINRIQELSLQVQSTIISSKALSEQVNGLIKDKEILEKKVATQEIDFNAKLLAQKTDFDGQMLKSAEKIEALVVENTSLKQQIKDMEYGMTSRDNNTEYLRQENQKLYEENRKLRGGLESAKAAAYGVMMITETDVEIYATRLPNHHRYCVFEENDDNMQRARANAHILWKPIMMIGAFITAEARACCCPKEKKWETVNIALHIFVCGDKTWNKTRPKIDIY